METSHSNTSSWLPAASRPAWLIALVLGLAFFANEHNTRQSLKNDFTEDADEMVATAEGGNSLRRVAFLAIAATGALAFVFARQSPLPTPSPLAVLLIAMVGLCCVSAAWAQDFGMCVRRLLVLVLCVVGTVGVARRLTLRELCIVALAVSSSLVMVGVGCELMLGTFRPWSGEYRFSGTVHPNTQGAYLAVMCFSSLCLWMSDRPRRWLYGSLLAISLVLLVLTKSRTSTAGVLGTLGMMWLVMSCNRVRVYVPAIGATLAATGLLVLLMSGADADAVLAKIAFMGRQEDTESFSGRTTIWPVVTYYIDRQYWLGYGYESFWTPSIIEDVTAECQWPIREAHSAYLDMMLSLGLIGVLLYCGTVIAGMATGLVEYGRSRDVCALFWFAMGLNGLFNGLFESGMVMITFPTFITAVGLMRLALFRGAAKQKASSLAWQSQNFPSYA
jgi:O-antigen ligase